jgi:hypothetical protein
MPKPQNPPTQRTDKGHEIPVPKRKNFLRDLNRVSKDADPHEIVRAKKPKGS